MTLQATCKSNPSSAAHVATSTRAFVRGFVKSATASIRAAGIMLPTRVRHTVPKMLLSASHVWRLSVKSRKRSFG